MVSSIAFLSFGLDQVVSIAQAVVLAALPSLPTYSAVLLMTAPGGSRFSSCLEILHWPMLIVLGMTYLVTALVPAVRTEPAANNALAHKALKTLEILLRLT